MPQKCEDCGEMKIEGAFIYGSWNCRECIERNRKNRRKISKSRR